MLQVKTPEEVFQIIEKEFHFIEETETVTLYQAYGRTLAEDITAEEYVPDFNRSTVDGYAVAARDTFGCSDAIPAILTMQDEILMPCTDPNPGDILEFNGSICIRIKISGICQSKTGLCWRKPDGFSSWTRKRSGFFLYEGRRNHGDPAGNRRICKRR